MVEYSFRGNVPNKEILSFYNSTRIDCFVMASENEGLPVSIMEAESAGIPIVSTNVGGISELISENGVLVDADCRPEELADAIKSCVLCPDSDKKMMGHHSRTLWEEKFDAKKNAVNFVQHIKERHGAKVNKILFLTEGYPFILSEKSFLESEVKELLKYFDVTIIARLNGQMNSNRQQNADKEVAELMNESSDHTLKLLCYEEDWSIKIPLRYTLRYFLDSNISAERKNIMATRSKVFIRIWESIKYYSKALEFYKWFMSSEAFSDCLSESTLLYSYWNLQPLLGVSLNRRAGFKCPIMSRAHGYDYQDEQWPKSNRKPFKEVLDAFVDEIVFVSEAGKKYYLSQNGLDDNEFKYYVSYLGSNDATQNAFSLKKEENDTCLLVSCASLIPLKRVNLIIDALNVLERNVGNLKIQWIHFGDGVLRQELEDYAGKVLGG